MVHQEKKYAKIIEELTMYFFTLGADKMSSGIELKMEGAVITFRANYEPENAHGVDTLEKYLNEPKNAAIEDVYWELAGSGDPGETSQLLLIGMMIDEYKMIRHENEVEIIMFKDYD